MNLARFIAKRYIVTKRSYQFISIISTISIIGIAIGVAVLISVMSLMNGFRGIAESQMKGFDPHLRISPKSGNLIENFDSTLAKVKKSESIKSIAPLAETRIVAITKSKIKVMSLNLIDTAQSEYFNYIKNSVTYGEFSLSESNNLPQILIGIETANELNLFIGDTISLVSASNLEESIRTFAMQTGQQVRIAGIFQSNIKDYDKNLAISDYSIAYNLGIYGFSSIDIRLKIEDESDEVKNELQALIPNNLQIETWKELNSEMYKVMQTESTYTFIILSIIILIAVFNILASLAMTVTEKRKDIAILKTIGANDKFIRRIYLNEGMLSGLLGVSFGVILGLGFCYGQIYFKWFRIDAQNTIIDAFPISVNYYDVLLVASLALVLSFFAAYFPARNASKTIIAEAIRGE